MYLQWLVTSSPPDPSGGHVTLGLLVDTDHAFSILDMGPPADSSEVSLAYETLLSEQVSTSTTCRNAQRRTLQKACVHAVHADVPHFNSCVPGPILETASYCDPTT